MSEFFTNAQYMKYLAIGLFVLMYVLLVLLPKRRAIVALATATLMVILQVLPLDVRPPLVTLVVRLIATRRSLSSASAAIFTRLFLFNIMILKI